MSFKILICYFLISACHQKLVEDEINKDSQNTLNEAPNIDQTSSKNDELETVIEYITTSVVTKVPQDKELLDPILPNKINLDKIIERPTSPTVKQENDKNDDFKDKYYPEPNKEYDKKIVYEISKDLENNTIRNLRKCYILTTLLDFSPILEIVKSFKGNIKYIYKEHINGFSFCIDNVSILEQIKSHPSITSLEEDVIFKQASVQPSISNYLWLISNYKNYIFNNYLLDNFIFRILGLNKLFKFLFGSYEYKYTGKNTRVYLVDSSIDQSNANSLNISRKTTSCNDHGNFMKELLLNPRYGYSKDSELIVLDGVGCNGEIRLSTLLKYLEAVKKTSKPTVLLFGVYGPYSSILNGLVEILSNKGIIIVSPSGNNHDSSCLYSPGSSRSSVTVGSVDKHGNISNFSNHGSCTRLYGLGENIYSSKKVKGTSFAAANIASAILMYLEKKPEANFNDVWMFLDRNSSWQLLGGYLTLNIPKYTFDDTQEDRQDAFYGERYSASLIYYFAYALIIVLIIGSVYFLYRWVLKRRAARRRREYIIPPNTRYE